MAHRIPIYAPNLEGNEKKYVMECLDSTWISSKGKFIAEFEKHFSEYSHIKYATTVSNGTVALHVALLALGIGLGDEVIVPTLTYIASVNTIAYTGATPVFVDSVRKTWQMDPEDIRRKISPRTKAIMAVHLYGHPCEMKALGELARDHGLFLLEDCAEALGSRYDGQPVGTFGDISTFSFFGNKTVTTGEGGMVATNHKTLLDRCVHIKGQGLAAHREYWHDIMGYNYRMTNICAAIGLAQLERADDFLARKREIALMYREGLQGLDVELHGEHGDVTSSFWMVSILVDEAAKRDPLRKHLNEHGIETRPLFYPVHTMPMYSQRFQLLPVAEDLAWRGINLPSWPGLTDSQVDEITRAIREFYDKSSN